MLQDKLTGKDKDKIPNIAFRLMTFVMKIVDSLNDFSNKNFHSLNLKQGQTVIDYGCGPARYIMNASKTVGESGKVIAIDIHPLAIKNVNGKIKKHQLLNVVAVQANGYTTPLESGIADVVYAIDMFHMISQPNELLKELSRLTKDDGIIIIEDGHQAREKTKHKIKNSGILNIFEETKMHVKCRKSN